MTDIHNFAIDFEVQQFEKHNAIVESPMMRDMMVEWLVRNAPNYIKAYFIEWLKTQKREESSH